jgi:colicin import membrane protein
MNLTINGRQVTVDDSFRNLSREDQDATVEEIANSLPAAKKEASGVAAGAFHGGQQLAQGIAETAKQQFGIGEGRKDLDPNYVPADIRGGSWNPLKWNYGQIPQAIAEQAPGLTADIATGAVARKLMPGGAKAKALAALAGAGASAWTRTAGDTSKEAAVARTGDANADTNSADRTRGGLTALGAAAINSVLPTRFIPGMNKLGSVGAEGLRDAIKTAGGTIGIGAGSGAASDLITQAGTKLGTDAKIDLERTGDAAVNGAVTAGAFGAPKLAGDAIRAGNLREFGGVNKEATANYATRLAEHGEGLGGLGNAKRDSKSQQLVVSDLKNELGDAARSVREQAKLSPDADNALQRAQRGETITPKDLALIERETAGAPDGDNTAYLARTLRMAQLAQSKGSYSEKGWAGGISGSMDRNLAFLLNPTRAVGGAIGTAAGMHIMGLGNPKIALGIGAGYLGARAFDGMTGMRSPAKSFAEHFADQSAALRKPTGPMSPPQGPQPQGPIPNGPWNPAPPRTYGPTGTVTGMGPAQVPQGPWGPKPLPTTAVPQVQQAAPAAPQPAMSPIAMAMLKQSLKQGLPPDPTQQAQPAAPEPINPLALPRDITTPAKNVVNGMMLAQKLKQEAQAKDAVASLPSPLMDEAPLDVTRNPLIGKRAGQLVSAAKALQKYTGADVEAKEAAQAERAEAQAAKEQARAEQKQQTEAQRAQAKAEAARARAEKAEAAVAKAKDKETAKAELAKAKQAAAEAKEAAKLELAKVKAASAVLKQASVKPAPEKISKANGKFKAKAEEPNAPYEPLDEKYLYPKDISAEAYAIGEAGKYGARSPMYMAKAEASGRARIAAEQELLAKYPTFAHAIKGLVRQLHVVGTNPVEKQRAVNHFADFITDPAAAKAVREAFH